jgi:hypothetical protein
LLPGSNPWPFVGYFILSLIFFPLALIMAYMVTDRRGLYVRD